MSASSGFVKKQRREDLSLFAPTLFSFTLCLFANRCILREGQRLLLLQHTYCMNHRNWPAGCQSCTRLSEGCAGQPCRGSSCFHPHEMRKALGEVGMQEGDRELLALPLASMTDPNQGIWEIKQHWLHKAAMPAPPPVPSASGLCFHIIH